MNDQARGRRSLVIAWTLSCALGCAGAPTSPANATTQKTTGAQKKKKKSAPPTTTARCVAKMGPFVARRGCSYGALAIAGEVLLIPRACRLPLASGVVERHTVEFRDLKSGRRVGQASLPPKPTTDTSAPAAGTIMSGPFPLFVWQGGIAAIQVQTKVLKTVFEPTGTLAGVARHKELLAVVDKAPSSPQAPAGAMEWTIIDFGAGAIRGQRVLPGGDVEDVGFEAKGAQLWVWLRARGRRGAALVTAPISDSKGQPLLDTSLNLKLQKAPASWTSAGSKLSHRPNPKGHCPVMSGADAALPMTPWVSLDSVGSGRAPASGALNVPLPRCVVATTAGSKGVRWAWLKDDRGALKLVSTHCP